MMAKLSLLLVVLIAWSCNSNVPQSNNDDFRREFEALLDYIPTSKLDRDSMMNIAMQLDSGGQIDLLQKVELEFATYIEQQRDLEKRAQRIKNQFNPRTGAHFKVQESVQESMNNPESFEHVSTSYTEHVDHLMIDMHFRMPVSPGVTMLHQIVAKVDLEGNVLDGDIIRVRE